MNQQASWGNRGGAYSKADLSAYPRFVPEGREEEDEDFSRRAKADWPQISEKLTAEGVCMVSVRIKTVTGSNKKMTLEKWSAHKKFLFCPPPPSMDLKGNILYGIYFPDAWGVLGYEEMPTLLFDADRDPRNKHLAAHAKVWAMEYRNRKSTIETANQIEDLYFLPDGQPLFAPRELALVNSDEKTFEAALKHFQQMFQMIHGIPREVREKNIDTINDRITTIMGFLQMPQGPEQEKMRSNLENGKPISPKNFVKKTISDRKMQLESQYDNLQVPYEKATKVVVLGPCMANPEEELASFQWPPGANQMVYCFTKDFKNRLVLEKLLKNRGFKIISYIPARFGENQEGVIICAKRGKVPARVNAEPIPGFIGYDHHLPTLSSILETLRNRSLAYPHFAFTDINPWGWIKIEPGWQPSMDGLAIFKSEAYDQTNWWEDYSNAQP